MELEVRSRSSVLTQIIKPRTLVDLDKNQGNVQDRVWSEN